MLEAPSVKRVLIVSANMGEGHNATGRALEERVHALWPDAQVRWVDTLDAMGKAVGPAFRWTYVTNVESTPWLYEFFYDSLWHRPWFAHAAKRFVAEWAGRSLRGVLREFRPDLVLPTYPLGTAGLNWLRRRGELSAPVGAWISDFAPHPFWVYDRIDRNVVMHDVATGPARVCVPKAPVSVSRPPVTGRFVPGDRLAARKRLGLPVDGFVAVVSCGSLGFGSVAAAVHELLTADDSVTVLAVCGRNDALRAKVNAVSPGDPRLIAYGWTDEVPDLLAACDVLVTNAGGATSLEALACERAVLMYQPIAAHGKANARLMADAGLALLCPDRGSLTRTVRELLAEPTRLAAIERRAREHVRDHPSLDEALVDLAGSAPAPHRVRAQDSIFLYADGKNHPQQLGAVLILHPKEDGTLPGRAEAEVLFGALPGGRNRMRRRWLRHPRLVDDRIRDSDIRLSLVDISEQVAEQGEEAALDAALGEFFSARLDPYQYAGRARLVSGLEGGRAAFLVSSHHSFADGMAVTGSLVSASRGNPWPQELAPFDEPEKVTPRQLVRGLYTLARGGAVKPNSLNRTVTTRERRYRRAWLDQPGLNKIATELGVTVPDVVLGLLAEALRAEVPDTQNGARLTVPQSTRSVRTFRSAGNHTGAIRLDLPVAEMELPERIKRTAEALRAEEESGAPAAARLVVRAMGGLPAPLHRVLAGNFNSGNWFNMIASILPGARGVLKVRGSLIGSVYPILPLAKGTAFAAGFMLWAKEVTVCIATDPDGVETAERLCARIEAEYAALRMRTA